MKILKNDINLKSTLLSGQAFRIKENEDQSFTIILNDRVINIKEDNDYLIVKSNNIEDLENKVKYYLDYETNYDEIISYFQNKNEFLKKISNSCKGYKILRQDKLEMFISYIISQNNNVKRISNSIEKLSILCGEKIKFENNTYYLFPTLENLSKLSIEQIRSTGVGFRDKYIYEAIKFLNENKTFLDNLDNLDSQTALNKLCSIKGIGLKVASCILLFGYHRFDVFPIDTWVIKNVTNNFPNIKPTQKEIKLFAENYFSPYSGLAIQYMFNYERNEKTK